jgi:hypothetical protein
MYSFAATNKRLRMLVALSPIVLSGAGAATAADLCVECIAVKLERPVVARGPSSREPDAPVSMTALPDGTFRAFAANGTTFAIDGATPFALSGPARAVLEPGPPGSPSECGRWLTTLMPAPGKLYGLIHNEQHCGNGPYKSMSIASSADEGLTWNVLGEVISGDDAFVPGHPGGEGDCTAANGHDGYWYAYCLRLRDWKNIVARAPLNDPSPGKWMKWTASGWIAPGLGGTATALAQSVGTGSAYWTGAGVVIRLATTTSSMQLSVSRDKVHFDTLAEPVVRYDGNDWKRPAPTDLYAYPSMIAPHGFNDIGRDFFLAYTFIPAGEDFSHRYLVVQKGTIAMSRTAQYPQVRVALTRWVDSDGRQWTTADPPLPSQHSHAVDAHLGYVMTALPMQAPGVRLDECFYNQLDSQSDSGFIAEGGACAGEGSARRRIAGYIFRDPLPGTVPLYSCLAKSQAHFVSNRADCENAGLRGRLLGFALR